MWCISPAILEVGKHTHTELRDERLVVEAKKLNRKK